jgi:hypothetical protein
LILFDFANVEGEGNKINMSHDFRMTGLSMGDEAGDSHRNHGVASKMINKFGPSK